MLHFIKTITTGVKREPKPEVILAPKVSTWIVGNQ
jgi:hypothetical protein